MSWQEPRIPGWKGPGKCVFSLKKRSLLINQSPRISTSSDFQLAMPQPKHKPPENKDFVSFPKWPNYLLKQFPKQYVCLPMGMSSFYHIFKDKIWSLKVGNKRHFRQRKWLCEQMGTQGDTQDMFAGLGQLEHRFCGAGGMGVRRWGQKSR